jgi:hypothetical protein
MHRIRRHLRLVRAVPLAVLCAACAAHPYPYHEPAPSGQPVPCDSTCDDRVGVTYLGSGGFLIRHGGDAILTAPFLSAPRAPQLLLPLRPNRARVDSLVRAWVGDTGAVRAVLVGHSHYDHVLDLPYIFQRWLTNPAVQAYGSRGLAYTFAADRAFRTRIHVVEDSAGTAEREGGWFQVPGFRFMPLLSDHAPHFWGMHLLPRRIHRPLPYRPWWILSYPQGTTLAYLVDVTDGSGKVVFRLHYQDAASTPPLGFPPAAELARQPVDLAIICGAAFAQVRGYPDSLLGTLHPRNAVVGHWEDFLLHNRRNPPPGVPLTDYVGLERRMSAAAGSGGHPWVPVPGETRWFCACTARPQAAAP